MNTQTKALAESGNQTFARTWATGLERELTVRGVPLARVMEYDLLRVAGSVWLAEQAEAQPVAAEQAVQNA